jgi:hypothetical protein
MTPDIQVVKFDPLKAIEQVKSKVAPYAGLKINGLQDKEGYEKVRIALGECVSTRTGFTATCKEARDDANKYSKYVIEQENIGVAEIKKVEDALRAEKDKIDAEKEAIKQEKERAELAKAQIKIDALAKVGYTHDIFDLRLMDEVDFQKLLAEKTEVFKILEEKRLADEDKAFRKQREELAAREKAIQDAEEKATRDAAEAERIKIAQENAVKETEARIKREQEEEKQKEEAETARLNKVKKYQSWLAENGYTKETESEFKILKNEETNEVSLYKKISTYKI